jgi:hypothetical protein
MFEWKYEVAVKQLLDLGFHSTSETADFLKQLGEIHKTAIIIKLQSKNSAMYVSQKKHHQ